MNIPNRLTVLRIALTPVFMLCMLIKFPHHLLAALAVFAAASITDTIDGNIARRRNLITDFGKFLDPLADKMLTTAAFLCFLHMGVGCGIVWITFIVLLREFFITSLRLVSSSNGKVIAANIWGKLKTISQMTAIVTTVAFLYIAEIIALPGALAAVLTVIYNVLLWISAVLAVISGAVYFHQNREFIDIKK